MNSPETEELRGCQRYRLDQPVVVQFGTISAALRDTSEKGVQIEHAEPVKLGIASELRLPQNPQLPPLRAKVIWSRLSKTPDASGKYLYETGVTFTEESDANRRLLEWVIRHHGARADESSLKRKREASAARASHRNARPTMRPLVQREQPEISTDTILLIQHARRQLKSRPDEAVKWYNRAKFSGTTGEDLHVNREDILAVWEYLERSIDVEVIASVFEQQK